MQWQWKCNGNAMETGRCSSILFDIKCKNAEILTILNSINHITTQNAKLHFMQSFVISISNDIRAMPNAPVAITHTIAITISLTLFPCVLLVAL